MRNPKLLLVFALLATGIVKAQTPAQSSPTRTPDMAQPLPVPGGGAGLGPGGIPKAEDQHTPTLEEARQKAKAQSDQIADLQARRLAQQLNLDSAQLNRVRTIFIEREDELRKTVSPEAAANDSHPLTPEERQLEIQQIRDGAIRKLQVVLTPEQKQQFDAMIAHSRAENARRSAMSRRMRPPISGTAPAAGTTPAAPAAAPAPAAPPQ